MTARKPVGLTDEERVLLKIAIDARLELATLDVTRQRFSALVSAVDAEPEPWLTVNDNGEPVRMVQAGCWERPVVDLDALEKAKARYYRDNQQRLDDEADGRPWSQEMVDAMLARADGWHDRAQIVEGPRFYHEGERRPEGAVPLYRAVPLNQDGES